MHYLYLIIVLCQAYRALAQHNTAPQTTAAPNSLHKRDPTATVLLGPASDYLQVSPSAPTVTGRDFTLAPGATPSDGFDFYMGPDLVPQVQSAVEQNCANPSDPQCLTSIVALIPTNSLDLQRRQTGLGVLVGSAIAAAVGVIISILFNNGKENVVSQVHIPASAVTQIQAATTASTVVFATATDDPSPVTITVTPTADPTGSVTTATNGDLSINLPEDFATRLNDLIAQEGGCASNKRDLSDSLLSCLVTSTGAVMENVVNGPAADLVLLQGNFRAPGNAALLGALNQIIQNAAAIQTALGLAQDQFNTLADAAFWLTYAKLILKESVGTSTTIANNELGEDDDSKDCPPDDRTPSCMNCGGNQGGNICVGFPQSNNLWKGCVCVDGKPVPPRIFTGTLQELNDAQNALANLPLLPTQTAVLPACATTKVQVETALFKSLITTFCKDHTDDISTSTATNLTNKDAIGSWPSYDDWVFEFSFLDQPGPCDQPCEKLYNLFSQDTQCSYDSHTFASNGFIFQDCGVAGFSITEPDSPPAQTTTAAPAGPTLVSPYEQGTCSLKLTQWNNRDGSTFDSGPGYGTSEYSVAVTIYDNGGRSIGSSTRKDAGDAKPLTVTSKLESAMLITPEERDDYIQFGLTGQAWPSNNKDGDPRAHCDVGAWNGGVQRDMTCTFACGYSGGKSSDGSN